MRRSCCLAAVLLASLPALAQPLDPQLARLRQDFEGWKTWVSQEQRMGRMGQGEGFNFLRQKEAELDLLWSQRVQQIERETEARAWRAREVRALERAADGLNAPRR